MRLVFMGSPDFSLPCLEALVAAGHQVLVVTRPDRPAGRGRKSRSPAVKEHAARHGLPVLQPVRLHEPETLVKIREWEPQVVIVAAFGSILREELLSLPPLGCLNVHASLLPRWRGAAPVQAAILHGDSKTGVSIMKMDAGLDTGPVFAQRELDILPEETGGQLSGRLAQLGAGLLLDVLPRIVEGEIVPEPQDTERATYAPLLQKSDGLLLWTKPSLHLARQVRAYEPWPGSHFMWKEQRVLVRRARVVDAVSSEPGKVTVLDGAPAVGAGDGLLLLEVVQPAGRPAMEGRAFLSGARDFVGAQLEPSRETEELAR